jgi:hypothetical protein
MLSMYIAYIPTSLKSLGIFIDNWNLPTESKVQIISSFMWIVGCYLICKGMPFSSDERTDTFSEL